MKYTARIKDYGIGTTKAGDPKAMVMFTFKDENGTSVDMTWSGSLREGRAREITIDALLVCGLKGNDLSKLAQGAESGVLDLNRDLSITVEEEEYNGKTYKKIKWINAPGGAGFRDIDPSTVKKLTGMNLSGDVEARRKQSGIKDKVDEVPF